MVVSQICVLTTFHLNVELVFFIVHSGFKLFNYHVDTAQYCTYDFMEALDWALQGPMVHSMPSIA